MPKRNDIHLLLLGMTGLGKSATGNAILGREAFESIGSTTSVTGDSKRDVIEIDDERDVYVVDTPGVFDTNHSNDERIGIFVAVIREAIAMNPQGYHAILLVLRYGGRFTDQQYEVIVFLKKVFGENFVKDHCLILMTHGDNYKSEPKENPIFQHWCEKQSGAFKVLYEEVGKKAILFDNRGTQSVIDEQRTVLISLVDAHMFTKGQYTDEKFKNAQVYFHKFMIREGIDAGFQDQIFAASKVIAKLSTINSRINGQNSSDVSQDLSSLNREISRAIDAIGNMKPTWFVKKMKPFMERIKKCVEQFAENATGQQGNLKSLQHDFNKLRDEIFQRFAQKLCENISIKVEAFKDRCKIL